MSKQKMTKEQLDWKSKINNPNNPEYQKRMDHNANIKNPNSPEYKAACDNRAEQKKSKR
ncbi:hypothetical protein [Ureaplasma zalophigenitalium]|uniref:Uncharacterized protein n=1 Tax=Ureaplasma zalophigenitalium TaxID=907723 RepID=A0ABT3BPF5_9BACT|nr:hypothetical protein [Ureaplasma zalophigenitalium]MCV3754111.1 hypothetical protein [Ureaplasma zalophigenitalium]